ncbi:hypothetical protein MNBD_GAMMA24-1261 [hydrothermal vent metagenome]|uniref:DsrE/DsrF-like family protein n=1 Tax=hydrothermal vent metagenome TaxID=652676 RepID=A0A3B1BNX8_9ZZZZ
MKYRLCLTFIISLFLLYGCASPPQGDGIHRVVIQVSTDDPRAQTIALNNAINLQRKYGAENVQVEIVAYGPGISLVLPTGKQARRVRSLARHDAFIFSADQHTLDKIRRRIGKTPRLIDGVGTVPMGVARVVELQEQGYSYIRP